MWNIFGQVDVYLNEPIEINELIKLANQSIQQHTRDKNGKDRQLLFLKEKSDLVLYDYFARSQCFLKFEQFPTADIKSDFSNQQFFSNSANFSNQ